MGKYDFVSLNHSFPTCEVEKIIHTYCPWGYFEDELKYCI